MSLSVVPLFRHDCARLARRWQTYAVRSLLLGCLLTSMVVVWWWQNSHPLAMGFYPPALAMMVGVQRVAGVRFANPADFGSQLFTWLIGLQLILVMLAAPPVMAGAICHEKRRGTLAQLLASGLPASTIVLCKLASAMLWIFTLLACTMPVLFLASLLGGIDPEAILAASLVIGSAAVFACSLALAISVEAEQTHDALTMTYFMLALFWLAPLLPLLKPRWIPVFAPASLEERLSCLNPFIAAFLPYVRLFGPLPWPDQVRFITGTLAISAIAVVWAAARLQLVTLRSVDRGATLSKWSRRPIEWRRRLFRPLLELNPVMWRECRRGTCSACNRIMLLLYLVVAAGLSACLVLDATGVFVQMGVSWAYDFRAMSDSLLRCLFGTGLLLLGIVSVTGLTEDRDGGEFEILLTTPMSTRSIVWGKWFGACRLLPAVAIWPALIALAVDWRLGPFHATIATALVLAVCLVYALAFTTLGVALAVWIPQTGRAVAVGVTILVSTWFAGWAAGGLMSRDHESATAAVSPLFGLSYAIEAFRERTWVEQLSGMLSWMFLYASGTAILFYAIDKTIYQCLGRMRPCEAYEVTCDKA